MGTPAKKRTPAQKKLAKGLETSLRITWEEVAEAVAANPADKASASGSSARSTRSSGRFPVRRPTRWRWSNRRRRPSTRLSSAAATTRGAGPRSRRGRRA